MLNLIYKIFNINFLVDEPEFKCYNLINSIDVDRLDIDFQRFAAEDEGRTEEPTERRKREEREKGNVPRTNEIPSALILLATVLTIFLFSTYIV
jgi:flagellar biosynthetic protein FlhB